MLLALLLSLMTAPQQAPSIPDTTAVTLAWTKLNGSSVRLRATSSMMLDSTQPTIATDEHVFSLAAAACPPTRTASCPVQVGVLAARYGFGPDSATALASMHDLGAGGTTRVLLAPNGAWEMTSDSGATFASGFVVEELSDWLPVSLPKGPVRVGDSWPVHLFSRRMNRRVGLLQEEFTGRATLDSVGGPHRRFAWISVVGTDSGLAGASVGRTTVHSVIRWDLVEGAPDSAATVAEGPYDAAPNEFSPAARRFFLRTRSNLQRVRETPESGAP